MRRRPHRHPALEAAVFAAALLLAAFVGRELWRRRSAAAPAFPGPESAMMPPLDPRPTSPFSSSAGPVRRTEVAVTGVPPMKLTRVQHRKPKPAVVPAPK